MNKKAFVLMETIVVIVVISVALLTIFASYNKILSKVKTENKYDTSEYIYMTYYIKEYLRNRSTLITLSTFDMENSSDNPTNYYQNNFDVFNVKGVYLLTNLNSTSDDNLKKFDGYMIDYIRKLDVLDNDTILVVEYNRTALDSHGIEIIPTNCSDSKKDVLDNCSPLNETYIASLRWE